MISKQSSQECIFILLDEITRAMIDPLVDCRKLWGGPFNPKFDVCKNLEDTLKKVNCNIHFLSKRLKVQIIAFATYLICMLQLFCVFKLCGK